MRKIVLNAAVSLDGKIEGPKGEYDWCFVDQDYGMKEFLASVDTIFYGRKSYEVMMREGKGVNPFAQFKNYVFSTSLKPGADYTLINNDIVSAVKQIKNEEGKDIWLFGGASLLTALMALGLVDELQLAVHPLILGEGKELFQGVKERVKTRLIEAKSYDSGLMVVKHEVLK